MERLEQADLEALRLIAEENYAHARDHEHLRAQVTSTLVAAAFVLIGLAIGNDVTKPMSLYASVLAIAIGLLNVVLVYLHTNRFKMHVSIARAAKERISSVKVGSQTKKRMSLYAAWLVVAALPIFAGICLFFLSLQVA